MHIKLLRIVIAACKMRIYEGDHPTTPAFSVEVLESAIFDLSDKVVDLRTTLDTAEQKLASVERETMKQMAQLAFDTQSDDPKPGDWDDACLHIQALILGALKPTESAAPHKGRLTIGHPFAQAALKATQEVEER